MSGDDCRHGLDPRTCAVCLGRPDDLAPTLALEQPVAACRSCNAPVIWVVFPSGKRNPLDADPVDDGTGNVVLDGPGEAHVVPRGRGTHVSHFATCQQANSWRRRSS